MAEEKKEQRKLDMDELEYVAGGTGAAEWISRLFRPEEETAKAYKNTWTDIMSGKPAAGNGAAAEAAGTATQKAYCPVCGAETEFTVFSGARGICRICGNMRQDL